MFSKKGAFYYLNLAPPLIDLPDGTKKPLKAIHWPFSPSQCFCQEDLYTTNYFGFTNDEIERYLFGKIDSDGAKAIEAMAEQNYEALHANFINFFQYIDIQKIRTPKGFAWIKSKYPSLTHNQLLLEMQRIRQLHCTMWAEAVREIVYASNSKIKFIVSDHPVTIYNPACPPTSEECKYPNEPRIEMKASQTIFPLDSNRCLILTNLDYARNPNLPDRKAYRPNANPFRDTMVRMDNTICKRKLNDDEVAMVNCVIKHRAKQFVAAENKEWLYPEKITKRSWEQLGKVLLPPKDELYHFGGETYVKYNDGRVSYHDAYGRTENTSYLEKKTDYGKVGVNDLCPCGSGKKFKKCCRDTPEDERPSTTERSIRERNLKFFDILVRILGLEGKPDWAEVRRNLTDKKIEDIHKAVAALWPPNTDLMALLPKPDPKVSRALYSGLLEPGIAYKNVAAFSLFADEILILNPFPNPNILRKEFSPIENPGKYRQITLKNIIFFMLFMPLIEKGYVNLIPDPMNFNSALREQIMSEAEKRRKVLKLDEKSTKPMEKIFKEDYQRYLFNASDDRLGAIIRRAKPEIGEDDLKKTIEYIKRKNEEDPLAPLQPSKSGEGNPQMFISHLSPNLELGMFLAQSTGSFILTHNSHRWQEICSSVNYFYGNYSSPWEPIASYLTKLELTLAHCLDHNDLLAAQKDKDLSHLRVALRNVWNAVQSVQPSDSQQINNLIQEIDQAKQKMNLSMDTYMKRKNKDCGEFLRVVTTKGTLSAVVAPSGHSTSAVYRLLLAHAGHEKYLKALPLCLYWEDEEEQENQEEIKAGDTTSLNP